MQVKNIELKPNKILIQPLSSASSSFSTEHKKYDRKSMADVIAVSNYVATIKPGDKVIYDDSNSIDFALEGQELSVITPEDIVAFIKEDK